MLPLDRFITFIQKHNLFSSSDRVLLAVSGGRDSVLLAHFFNACNFSFGIAHCNFGLRGEESDTDETFVRNLAAAFDAPFYSTRFDTAAIARAGSVSIQMAARELRYSWFEKIRQQHNYSCVAVAHLSDTTETILLNLIRGTGISGLHGILPKRAGLIRPLLFLRAEEVAEIVKENNIPFRNDSSNLSTKYSRNKLRLEVIPKLKEINPKLEQTFEQNSKRFMELEEFLNAEVEKLRAELFTESESGDIAIELNRLKEMRPQNFLMYELFRPYGFNEGVLADLAACWDGQPGKVFESATHELLLDRAQVLLRERRQQKQETILLNQDEAAVRLQEFTLIYQQLPAERVKICGNPCRAFFDAALLQFPLKLRHWEKGDYFFPFGMDGKKKLSDFFISQKIPLSDKKAIRILENGNGDIIWVVGYRTDNRYKITGQTKKVYIFEKHKPR